MGNFDPFKAQIVQHPSHQMHCSEGVLKAGVDSARINKIGETQLFNEPEALKKGMGDDVKNQLALYRNKAVERIVNDFLFVQ